VLGAWPGVGKSTLVDQFAAYVGRKGKRPCVYTNEMLRETRVARVISRMTGIAFGRINAKRLNDDEKKAVVKAAANLPFPIQECAGWSASEIGHHIRRHRWDLAIIDLATRIPATKTAEWDAVSGHLTDVAMQTKAHIVLVCQLNLERNKSICKPPPVGRDLRYTGAWYQDASNVLFIHREQVEKVDPQTKEPLGVPETKPHGHISVDKGRNGGEGAMGVYFDSKRIRFVPLDQRLLADEQGAVAA
jgi:replicative DNA helicase